MLGFGEAIAVHYVLAAGFLRCKMLTGLDAGPARFGVMQVRDRVWLLKLYVDDDDDDLGLRS